MNQAAALSCIDVGKTYAGGFEALHDVNLDVREGEILALLGPNGAGKSTLIHCITGLAEASEGSISVFGHDVVKDYRITRRLIGLVPQEVTFDPFFTPRETLTIQMGLMGVKPDRDRADEVLNTFSLWNHRDAYTRQLSGGMKRRLLVAKALVHRPKLLFLDEPTAGVDVTLRRELYDEVARLRDNGTTIVLTTHYIEEAEAMADRIAIIHHGTIRTLEPKEDLLARHPGKNLEDIFVDLTSDPDDPRFANKPTGASKMGVAS